MSNYAMVCQRHSTPSEECPTCRNFDQAMKKQLENYNTPPAQHVFVTGPKVLTWMKGIFGC